MLDTNICIYVIKEKPESVIRKFLKNNPEEMCISSVTYAELLYGVEKSKAIQKNRIALSLFHSPIKILEFNDYAAQEYGQIRADLEQKGMPIGSMDMLIAGHAKAEDLILVTNNTKEFQRVAGLKLENWAAE